MRSARSGVLWLCELQGNSTTYGPGESFVLRQGFECAWIQRDVVVKYFVMFVPTAAKL